MFCGQLFDQPADIRVSRPMIDSGLRNTNLTGDGLMLEPTPSYRWQSGAAELRSAY
jgi:hypothetical protein